MIRDALQRHGYTDRVVKTSVTTYTSRTSKKDQTIRRTMLKDPHLKLLIVVATSAFGMGMDIPHIQAIWQFEGLPVNIKLRNASDLIVCDLWQRGGRAARGHGMQGLFIILLEHNITEKETILQKRRLNKMVTSVSKDYNTLSRHYHLTHSRRNSITADPSSRNSDMLHSNEEEDNTSEGVGAALQVNGESSAAIVNSESTSTPKFSWLGLLAAACYQTFILAYLEESYYSLELRSELIDPA
jgi:superfamily II DNA/RNA helicase